MARRRRVLLQAIFRLGLSLFPIVWSSSCRQSSTVLSVTPQQDGGGGGGDGGEDLSGQLLELEERIAQLEKEKQKEEEVRNYMQLERVCTACCCGVGAGVVPPLTRGFP